MGFGWFWLIAMWASWLSHVFLWCSQEPPEDAPDAPRVSVGAKSIASLKSEAQRQGNALNHTFNIPVVPHKAVAEVSE